MQTELSQILGELYELMDKLEDIAEDNAACTDKINAAIDLLSEACDVLET